MSHPLVARGASDETVMSHICEGAVVGGRISKILPGVSGLIVQIDPHLSGKVHYTELADSWVPNPLSGYHEGQFVKCKVLNICHSGTGTVHVDLTLRSYVNSQSNRYEKIEDFHPDMTVEHTSCSSLGAHDIARLFL